MIIKVGYNTTDCELEKTVLGGGHCLSLGGVQRPHPHLGDDYPADPGDWDV